MKEHIEKKTCEYENLQKQTVQLKTAIQEKEIEIEGLKEDIANSKSQDECLKEKINAMEAKEADLEMELDQMKTRLVSEFKFLGYFFLLFNFFLNLYNWVENELIFFAISEYFFSQVRFSVCRFQNLL